MESKKSRRKRMTVKELRNILFSYPDNFQVVISDPVWLDRDEGYWATVDKLISAIGKNEKDNEIQLFYAQNIKEEFPDLQVEKIIKWK
jgi:hypothetical protein